MSAESGDKVARGEHRQKRGRGEKVRWRASSSSSSKTHTTVHYALHTQLSKSARATEQLARAENKHSPAPTTTSIYGTLGRALRRWGRATASPHSASWCAAIMRHICVMRSPSC
eukprot:scaffold14371_cov115-Isochrysis_galbana.AAC.4